MPAAAVERAKRVLPTAGRPDPTAIAAMLENLKYRQQHLPNRTGIVMDISQMNAVATVILNPLVLLHGPPGTGKTTTIAGLLWWLRKYFVYEGSILAAAQSNVAVDNMLETAMTRKHCRPQSWGRRAQRLFCLLHSALRFVPNAYSTAASSLNLLPAVTSNITCSTTTATPNDGLTRKHLSQFFEMPKFRSVKGTLMTDSRPDQLHKL